MSLLYRPGDNRFERFNPGSKEGGELGVGGKIALGLIVAVIVFFIWAYFMPTPPH